MHYVKEFNINGVYTRQVACIELHGKPNAATEGALGALGIDVDSPSHDVYKCAAVNGSIYTWELLSSGMSIISSTVNTGGEATVEFSYDILRTPAMYIVKKGDLILDREGYLYQIDSLYSTYCVATYTGTQIAKYGKSAYDLAVKGGFEGSEEEWIASLKGDKGDKGDQGEQGKPGNDGKDGKDGETPYIGDNDNWWIGGIDTGVLAVRGSRMSYGTYTGTGEIKGSYSTTLTFSFEPKLVVVMRPSGLVSGGGGKYGRGIAFLTPNDEGMSINNLNSNGTVSISGINVKYSGNTVSLGNLVSEELAYNVSGVVYEYFAFG